MEMNITDFDDWAQDAFLALSNEVHPSTEERPAFNNNLSRSTCSIPPSLLSHGSIECFGQVTPPPEGLSPVDPRRDPLREDSIPLEQLKNEALFPDRQMQALQNYQSQQQTTPEYFQEEQGRALKRRRTPRGQAAANKACVPASLQQDSANPQPPKRKRGRPKSNQQIIEGYTANSYIVQVSLARKSYLEKNRIAANKCRQRKKEYINKLKDQARVFSQQNKDLKENVATLREEILQLKDEVLRHAGCGFWTIDKYLARCTSDLLGLDASTTTTAGSSRKASQLPSPMQATRAPEQLHHESSAESLSSQFTAH